LNLQYIRASGKVEQFIVETIRYTSADTGAGTFVPDLVLRAGQRLRGVVTATMTCVGVVVMQWRSTVVRLITLASAAEMLLN